MLVTGVLMAWVNWNEWASGIATINFIGGFYAIYWNYNRTKVKHLSTSATVHKMPITMYCFVKICRAHLYIRACFVTHRLFSGKKRRKIPGGMIPSTDAILCFRPLSLKKGEASDRAACARAGAVLFLG
jgi:hypothetical protein